MKRFLTVLVYLILGIAICAPVSVQAATFDIEDAAESVRHALAIKSPSTGSTGEKLTLRVLDRESGSPVAKAGVWAAYCDKSIGLPAPIASSADLAASAVLLGRTDADGTLTFALDRVGWYLLVAVKDGYMPGFNWIYVTDTKTMVIKAPETVKMMQPVTIRVLEKSVLTVEIPVTVAGVWAINVKDAASLDNRADVEALASKHGIFLGYTDEKGYVLPAPKFRNPGRYWLVAVKKGFAQAVAKVVVEPLPTVTAVPLPQNQAVQKVKPNFSWSNIIQSIKP
jgi:hypothetical protein